MNIAINSRNIYKEEGWGLLRELGGSVCTRGRSVCTKSSIRIGAVLGIGFILHKQTKTLNSQMSFDIWPEVKRPGDGKFGCKGFLGYGARKGVKVVGRWFG
jgi:hypothetical protein